MVALHCARDPVQRRSIHDCPLVEIVHFHDCLRGEVEVFAEGVTKLRSSVEGGGMVAEVMAQLENPLHSQFKCLRRVFQAHSKAEDELIWPALRRKAGAGGAPTELLEGALEEDHADEEGLFSQIEVLLSRLEEIREGSEKVLEVLAELEELAMRARENLLRHLEKEETEVLPLIQKLFTNEEMARLVGAILGERPSELMHLILAMMFRNLSPESRADMLRHVKQAVDGTFFDRWLSYARLANEGAAGIIELPPKEGGAGCDEGGSAPAPDPCSEIDFMACYSRTQPIKATDKEGAMESGLSKEEECRMCGWVGHCPRDTPLAHGEFEAAVRAIARDPNIGMLEKSRAVQLLRTCAWSEVSKKRRTTEEGGAKDDRASRPGDIELSADDLAATHTPTGELGCGHYKRACKLRAECCGRLFTCRLCHDEANPDHAMDRYAVKDVLCMRCGTLQPVGQYCRSQACKGTNQPLAAYFCNICRLFDDDSEKDIYHCPYCNVCRIGKGLGVDYRHCMTCNACVSLRVPSDQHKCIEQALQRDCPVCSEPLFTSTSHYKVLPRCGHTLHRHCFQAYRETAYTCPICQKSMEDMTNHFASLDLLMQANPMPQEFGTWRSSILCQDCGLKADVPYHFCYHKCPGCSSYNTRVTSRGPSGSASESSGTSGRAQEG